MSTTGTEFNATCFYFLFQVYLYLLVFIGKLAMREQLMFAIQLYIHVYILSSLCIESHFCSKVCSYQACFLKWVAFSNCWSLFFFLGSNHFSHRALCECSQILKDSIPPLCKNRQTICSMISKSDFMSLSFMYVA